MGFFENVSCTFIIYGCSFFSAVFSLNMKIFNCEHQERELMCNN